MQEASEKVVRNPDGSIRAVLVAEWPELQAWRVLHGNSRILRFELWNPSDPLSMSEALSTIGNTDRFLISGESTSYYFPYTVSFISMTDSFHGGRHRRAIDQMRWLLHSMGVLDWHRSVFPGYATHSDQSIAWFRDLEASRAKAADLDSRMKRERMLADPQFIEEVANWAKSIFEPSKFVYADITWNPWSHFRFSSFLSIRGWDGRTVRDKMPEQKSLSSCLDMLSSSSGSLMVFADQQKAREWFESRLIPGQFSISEEEVEMFKLLGEPLPYLWLEEDLSSWAMSR